MARHIKDYQFTGAPDILFNSLNQYLHSEGYEYEELDGESVFKKGQGWLTSPTLFKFSFSGNVVRMETWMKYALIPGVFVGEIGLTGMVGAAVKGPWKKRIDQIERIIYSAQQSIGNNNPPSHPTQNNNTYYAPSTANTGASVGNPQPSNIAVCPSCKTRVEGDLKFCTNCGQVIPSLQEQSCQNTNQPMQGYQGNQQPNNQVNNVLPQGQFVSKREFIEKYASPSVKRDIKSAAITAYVCAGLTALVSIFLNPFGVIDALILAGLALGMHLGKSKICSILILIFSFVELILGIVSTGTPSGLLWVIAGIAGVVAFSKIDKQYKQFINQ